MRICLISREYPPDTGWGGIGAYTYQHARALKQHGHEVVVVSLTSKESLCDKDLLEDNSDPFFVPVYRAAWHQLFEDLSTVWISLPYTLFALKSSFALWRRFLKVHGERPFDVVEAPEHLGEALFAALSKICPLVVRLHTPHSKFIAEGYHNLSGTFDHQLLAMLERTTMLEADLLSSPSQDLAGYVASDCGIEADSIKIVRNPVDCEKFTPDGAQAIAHDGRVTVFFAGRLEERKGVHYLIDAIPQVLRQTPDVRFIIVGADTSTGPGKSSVLSALKHKLSRSGSQQSVTFVSHVSLAEMPDYYRSADICVVPSLYENAPYTVLEAQSCGKPVVGTEGGGSKEYIREGLTGFVVPVRDSQGLAEAIVKLVRDPVLRLGMAASARQLALEEFDKKVIVGKAIKTYDEAIVCHQERLGTALYRRRAEQSMTDFVTLLHDYHLGLCDLIYRHSFVFRLKCWSNLAFNRPRLCLAKCLLGLLHFLNDVCKCNPHQLESLRARLTTQVAEREQEKSRLMLAALLKSCQLPKVV